MRPGYRLVLILLAVVAAACGQPPQTVQTTDTTAPADPIIWNVQPDVVAAQLDAADRYLAEQAAVAAYLASLPPPAPAPAPKPAKPPAAPKAAPTPTSAQAGGGGCAGLPAVGTLNGIPYGGAYPPCRVLWRESRATMGAVNPTGCSGRGCYGPYQCDPKTCDGSLESVARVWAGGKGCGHWNAC